jgi:hypothetical protein
MQTKWVKEMQTSLMSLDAFTEHRQDNSLEEWCNPIMSKGTTIKIINMNRRRKIRERRSIS